MTRLKKRRYREQLFAELTLKITKLESVNKIRMYNSQMNLLNKLVSIPTEDGDIVGYLKEVLPSEENEQVVATTLVDIETLGYTYVACWLEDIEERKIH